MKKILILGASFLQLPAIQKAKEMGLYVGVVDYNPSAIGIKYADEYFEVSTIDEEAVYQVAKKFNADGIITLATDMPVRAMTYASEKLNLISNGYDTAIKTTDKAEMIKCFKKSNVKHPWYYVVEDKMDIKKILNKIKYPCISKPTDNAGSRGVMYIENEKELLKAIKYSKKNGRSGNIIIEEYLNGNEVSVEVMVINKVAHILQVTDKITTGAPHFVEMGHVQPSRLDRDSIKKIKDLAIKAIKAVNIITGPVHVEIMLTKEGPKMIELGARMGGDCITSHLVPLSTGIDMIKATIDLALGNKVNIDSKYEKGSSIYFLKSNPGTIKKITGIDECKKCNDIKQVVILKKLGDKISEISSSSDRIGYIISQSETANKAKSACENASKKIKIEVNKRWKNER